MDTRLGLDTRLLPRGGDFEIWSAFLRHLLTLGLLNQPRCDRPNNFGLATLFYGKALGHCGRWDLLLHVTCCLAWCSYVGVGWLAGDAWLLQGVNRDMLGLLGAF